MTADRDPFNPARQRLQDSLAKTSAAFDRWKFVLENQNTAASDDFSSLTRSIQVDLKAVNVDVANLNKVLSAVEQNRPMFPHIDDAELDSRRKAVNEIAAAARGIEDFMTSARSKKKIERDQRNDLMGPPGVTSSSLAGGAGAGAAGGRGGAAGAGMVQARRTQTARREQEHNAVLDDMSSALDRLHGTSTQIKGKLQTQAVLLDEMRDDAAVSENLMQSTMRKMDTLLAKSKSGRICCLAILIVIAVLLFFIIIYF